MSLSRRVFSGIQPTGRLHLGNYLGAVVNWVKLQEEAGKRDQVIFSIVDLHAMTMPYDATALHDSSLRMAASVLACGLDPQKCILFRQSAVRQHTELAWILGCVTPLGWLQRMVQFKQKSGKERSAAGLGLLSYPVLQAADILLYRSTVVPVGEDQDQHLELARDIANTFNYRYCGTPAPVSSSDSGSGSGSSSSSSSGSSADHAAAVAHAAQHAAGGAGAVPVQARPPFFPAPASHILTAGARVMSLRDGTKKMSKSDPVDDSRINLTDSDDAIAAKIRAAKTDSTPGFTLDAVNRPDKTNLLNIYAAVTGMTPEAAAARFATAAASAFKSELAEAVVARVGPIRSEYHRLCASDMTAVAAVLADGARAAEAIAEDTMTEVRKLTGYR